MIACEACPFDYHSFGRAEIGPRLVDLAEEHARRLERTRPVERLRAHPVEGWSALEYGCHVRDVLQVQAERIQQAQDADDPEFSPMRRDDRAVEERYQDEVPHVVAAVTRGAAAALVTLLVGLDDAGWARTGLYTWPEPQLRDVDWIGRHTVHELHHHLADVDRVLAAAANESDGP